MKILYLILGTKKSPWQDVELIQKKTWVSKAGENDIVRYVYGDGSLGFSSEDPTDFHQTKLGEIDEPLIIGEPVTVSDQSWTFRSVSGWGELTTNTVSAMKYALKELDFDFLIRTNISSYWNMAATRKMLMQFSSKNIYAGKKWTLYHDHSIEYVAGYGIIFSRDVVARVVENYKLVDPRIIDDVGLSLAISQLQVDILDLDQPIFETVSDVKNFDLSRLNRTHAFRCKSEVLNSNNEIIRNDGAIFIEIHRRLRFGWLYRLRILR